MPCCTPRITRIPSGQVRKNARFSKLPLSSGRPVATQAGPVDGTALNLLPGQAAACAILLAWSIRKRPIGWSIADIEVKSSLVAGKGVFARSRIEEGTAIGRFGGVLRTPDQMAWKAQNAPNSKNYVFQTDDGKFWDPTDAQGNVSEWPGPNFPWPFPVDPAMAYVNEPPVGAGGTNVYCTNGATADELLYVATQTIMPGAEVFVDYGLKYDRTHYGGAVCEKRIAEVYAEPKENSSVDGG